MCRPPRDAVNDEHPSEILPTRQVDRGAESTTRPKPVRANDVGTQWRKVAIAHQTRRCFHTYAAVAVCCELGVIQLQFASPTGVKRSVSRRADDDGALSYRIAAAGCRQIRFLDVAQYKVFLRLAVTQFAELVTRRFGSKMAPLRYFEC